MMLPPSSSGSSVSYGGLSFSSAALQPQTRGSSCQEAGLETQDKVFKNLLVSVSVVIQPKGEKKQELV